MVVMYDGSRFGGWQRITGESLRGRVKSVQGYLEAVLSACFKEDIKVIGSGRTDKGVHALGQVVNFYSSASLNLDEVLEELNYSFEEGIRILRMYEVDGTFHSRYDAVGKVYQYRILNEEVPSVFLRGYTYHVPYELNIKRMQKAAALLVGTHDFRGFSTFRKDVNSSVRTIYSAKIEEVITSFGRELKEIVITIEGNGFLYHMVRILVGTLIEIGMGKKEGKVIKEIFESKNRSLAGPTVYGDGLYLHKVIYK